MPARGRFINRKVCNDSKIAEYGDKYGPWALVFHHRLIAFLDRNGNVTANEYQLKGVIFPRSAGVTPEHCRIFSAGLVEFGLAQWFSDEGNLYLNFPKFRDNQHNLRWDREGNEYPEFTEDKVVKIDFAGVTPDELPTNSEQTPLLYSYLYSYSSLSNTPLPPKGGNEKEEKPEPKKKKSPKSQAVEYINPANYPKLQAFLLNWNRIDGVGKIRINGQIAKGTLDLYELRSSEPTWDEEAILSAARSTKWPTKDGWRPDIGWLLQKRQDRPEANYTILLSKNSGGGNIIPAMEQLKNWGKA